MAVERETLRERWLTKRERRERKRDGEIEGERWRRGERYKNKEEIERKKSQKNREIERGR